MLKSGRATVARRLIGASALALAIVAGPIAGPASAADQLEQFAGTGTGYALRVTLDLRDSPLLPILAPVLGPVVEAVSGQPFTGVIDQYFIKTSSEADASNTKARSALAEGLVNLDVVEASNIGQTVEKVVQTIALPTEDLSLITGTLGTLSAAILGGPNVAGTGQLDNLAVGLPLDALPVDIGTLLDDLVGALVGEGGVVTELLDSLLGEGSPLGGDLVEQLTGTISGITGPLGLDLEETLGVPDLGDSAAVTTALTDLLDVDALLGQITDLLDNLPLDGALAELEGLVNITGAQKSSDGTKAVAGSAASLQSLKVLGGLVDVGLLNLSSSSVAGGVKGSAENTSDCSIADVNIGGGALAISVDGTSITINGTEVPVVGDLIAQVKGLADQLLAALGIDVGLCETADVSVAADGRSASQSVSALRVEVAPLGLFRLIIDPTVQTAVAAQVGTESTSTPDSPSLPRTGAGMAVSIFGGLGLAVGAIMIRRRFV
ncbi:MAG: hypothetical protein WD646_06565 [Actinomycetota bacterium]